MKRFCVIGDPVLHSKSPAIHNEIIGVIGAEAEYLCQPIKSEELEGFLADMRAGKWDGCNVTMPHKGAVIPHLDWVDEGAARCGAVNTICNRNGKLYGYSTDGGGFCRMVAQSGVSVEGKTVLLLGAGGAAKSIAWALGQAGAAKLICANRTVSKAEELCNLMPEIMEPAAFDGETLCRLAAGSQIVVNATSLGMDGVAGQFEDFRFVEALPEETAVFDVIYHPARTELLRHAQQRGLKTRNGLGMLLHQAILALEQFLEQPLDLTVAEAAAKEGLRKTGETVED